MIKLCLAALLAFGAAAAAAQPPAATATIQPSVDTDAQRQALREFTTCLAGNRPRWAEQTLAQPYLGPTQARLASQALSGRDTCIRGNGGVELTFRTSSLVGSLAEHFVRTEIERIDAARLAAALSTVRPLNVTEDFAMCVASRNPRAGTDLALSAFGSAAEAEALRQLVNGVAPCTSAGEQLTVDLQSLRALTAMALYRAIRAVPSAAN